ncbi:MAG: protein-(glutamine-N5) methyltransferase, release factor-specific [Omnitrophica WOR_2 bacterium GWF2_38_59]|nr:MAG: protein-(glutamine-N5) methyltransferase, release factor-specific [Omnitrophica WOR_2 bacterium GWA2_37_7]OGX26609.1 MAG: protein-(glutamine-N5) methyltransferase, release factor-specific [Omnitrophica WOR_2 bacterium GWF2_38_59]OGX47734.1 MAG: protein-(glutamine-N5) methyltransferase, release factor-specific [Omnitrophica WOR_2 bacterium RIFOXYA2_FULL_38_17]OGX50424.1 MAG: protein-(glutamine-N5) methyltransferase, release factor-specific [Omnitrophica WOR_2 bacterium RIFOXYA12_FULL_38_1
MTENELMMTSVLNCSRHELYSEPYVLTESQKIRLHKMQLKRLNGEPVQYVVGNTEFYGSEFNVDRRALIPRPETELLVDLVVRKMKELSKKDLRVLDIGTGSGVIAVSIAKNIKSCRVDAVDISRGAIELAESNADKNFVRNNISFYNRDAFVFLKEAYCYGEKYDIIVSNPPYIKTSDLSNLPAEVKCEPMIALDGGEDGLRFYRDIIRSSKDLLACEGMLFLEIGDGQRSGVEKIFYQYQDYKEVTFEKDYVGTDRIIYAVKQSH